MSELTHLDLFLREIECYDMKWFDEIGGYLARAELIQLREDLKIAEENSFMNKANELYRENVKLRAELSKWK